MAGAKKTMKKITNLKTLQKRAAPLDFKEAANSFGNPLTVLEEGAEDLGNLFTPDIPVPEEDPLIPIPNKNMAELRAKKRRAKSGSSGRSSTILTQGLGG